MSCNSCSNITLPGVVGPAGAVGDAGATGPSSTITVGTVTSGTPAAVVDVGTPGAAQFNFTIPPGAEGPIGPNGTTVLEVDFTEYIEDQNTFSAVSKSFNIPTDTLEVNGDMVELEMYLISEGSDTAIYQVQVELDSNVINITDTFNTIFAPGGKFFYVRLQLVLTDTDEVTPVVDSYTAKSTSLEYAGNYSNGVAATKTMRVGNPTTGLNPAAILPLDVSLVSSVTGKNIKMFYYKLTSLKK